MFLPDFESIGFSIELLGPRRGSSELAYRDSLRVGNSVCSIAVLRALWRGKTRVSVYLRNCECASGYCHGLFFASILLWYRGCSLVIHLSLFSVACTELLSSFWTDHSAAECSLYPMQTEVIPWNLYVPKHTTLNVHAQEGYSIQKSITDTRGFRVSSPILSRPFTPILGSWSLWVGCRCCRWPLLTC